MSLRPREGAAGRSGRIDTVDLNRHIRDPGRGARRGASEQRRLPGLVLGDRVYVSGRDADVPVLKPSKLRDSGYRVQRPSAGPARPDHSGAALPSLRAGLLGRRARDHHLLHFALQGETLYVEFSSCLLRPLPTDTTFSNATAAALTGTPSSWASGVRSSAMMPIDLVRSPFDAIASARGHPERDRKAGGDQGAPRTTAPSPGIRELGIGTTARTTSSTATRSSTPGSWSARSWPRSPDTCGSTASIPPSSKSVPLRSSTTASSTTAT